MDTSESTVAFIGLGAMGSRMASRLLDAGHPLVVWNRSRDKAEPFAARGAAVADSPAAAAADADVVITMLADPAALASVTEGSDGVIAGLDADTTLIEMSTVGPASIKRLTAALPGAALIDAPVLGSLPEAEAGALKVFAGGSPESVAHWTPLLSVLGPVLHVGPQGSGAAAKLVANGTLFGTLGLLAEALQLAGALGLSRDAAYDVLAATPLAAQAERRRPAIESREFDLRFALALARKDVGLVLDAAATAGADLRLASAAASWLRDAEGAGLGAADYSALLGHIIDSRAKG